jgi:hypothetical protein
MSQRMATGPISARTIAEPANGGAGFVHADLSAVAPLPRWLILEIPKALRVRVSVFAYPRKDR